MKIKVTGLDSGKENLYEYSSRNWADRPACMLGESVIMWCPPEVNPDHPIVTSGRRWELVPVE
jgi:hypothetical protein